MNLHFFSSPFSQKIIQAFSWMLLHSLWQSLILAILTGILLLVTKKSKPALRYNLLTGILLTFFLAATLTFYLEYAKLGNLTSATRSDLTSVISSSASVPIFKSESSTEHPPLLMKKVMHFFGENATVIVAIWFLVFMLKTLRATSGLYYIQQLRYQRIHNVSEIWVQRLDELGKKMRVTGMIRMFESELVHTPMVIGFLKPIILVPIGFLANLPYKQVEAILLHELAHIKRRDYLVNLFQSFTENIFFFNPAVLWISYLIRQEREHCCDDLAIEVMQNKRSFVNALVLFQEYKSGCSTHGLAFSGKRNHLLDRVKRIIYNNNKQLDAMEKLFVTASLITVAALSVAFSPTEVKKVRSGQQVEELVKTRAPKLVQHEQLPADTLPLKSGKKSSNFEYHEINKNNKHYEVTKESGKMQQLKIDGKVIPKEKFEAYESEIEPILEEIEEQQEQAESHRSHAEEMRKEADVHRKDAEKLREDAEHMRKSTDELRKQAEAMRIDAEKIRSAALKFVDGTDVQAYANLNLDEIKKQAELARKGADKSRLSAEEMRAQAEVLRKQADEMRAKAEVSREEAEKMRKEYEKMQSDLINDLIKEGVIKDKNNLSYKLSNDELIVNGVKQPDQLLAKLKTKYIKDKSVEMVYNFKGRTGYTTTGLIYTR